MVINKHVVLDGRGSLTISNDVDIAQDSSFWTEDHDNNSPEHKSRTAPVAIADHVWIASRATILPGVTIKRGSVVATGVVVTKDVEELSIVGGVPAKVIGKRENKLSHKPKFWDYK